MRSLNFARLTGLSLLTLFAPCPVHADHEVAIVHGLNEVAKVVSIKFQPGSEILFNHDYSRTDGFKEELRHNHKSWREFVLHWINRSQKGRYSTLGETLKRLERMDRSRMLWETPEKMSRAVKKDRGRSITKKSGKRKVKLCWDSAVGEFLECGSFHTFGASISVEIDDDINNFFLPDSTKKMQICWDPAQSAYVECGTYGTYGKGIEVVVMVSQILSLDMKREIADCWDLAQGEYVICGTYGTYK